MSEDQLLYKPYSLKLKEPFGTAHGIRSTTEGMIVAIRSGDLVGYGEAFMPPYYEENQETMTSFFESIDVEKLVSFEDLSESLKYLNEIKKDNTAAKAAIDIALHDLKGKQLKKSVRKIYKIESSKPIFTSYTIGFDSIEKMLQKVKEAKGFKTLKIKLNGENDVEIISKISEITNQELFVDANQGWNDTDKAIETANKIIALGVRLIEQPFPKGMWNETRALQDKISISIIADEDVQTKDDIEKLAGYFDGINIKLMKCGGIAEAFEMIRIAKGFGLKILLGCMTESSIGISAAYQIAGLADWCDLDGNLLIKNDTCEAIKCVDGQLIGNNNVGIGITNDANLRSMFD